MKALLLGAAIAVTIGVSVAAVAFGRGFSDIGFVVAMAVAAVVAVALVAPGRFESPKGASPEWEDRPYGDGEPSLQDKMNMRIDDRPGTDGGDGSSDKPD